MAYLHYVEGQIGQRGRVGNVDTNIIPMSLKSLCTFFHITCTSIPGNSYE